MTESKHVLICDDDEGILEVLTIMLESEGYKVIGVTDGLEVFKILSEIKPSIILLDLWMPKLDGAEITKRLKANPDTKDIPVIIVSANKDIEKIAKKIGATEFITKPFDMNEVVKLIEKYQGSNA